MDGIRFDSRAEAQHYGELVLLKRAGIVTQITIHPAYLIVNPYRHPTTGKPVRGVNYVADFYVVYADGRKEVQDVKSEATRTKLYLLKKKLFESKYGIPIVEVMRK